MSWFIFLWMKDPCQTTSMQELGMSCLQAAPMSRNNYKAYYKKTKLMVFNPCWSKDFMPEMELVGVELEVVEEIRLLGLIVTPDMKKISSRELIARFGC